MITLNEKKKGSKKFVRKVFNWYSKEVQDENSWWAIQDDDEQLWINSLGGRCSISEQSIVLETVYAEEFEDLDWSSTSLNLPDSKFGWLDRNGKFYGCSYEDHDSCAYYLLKSDVSDIESKGWVRVYDDHFVLHKGNLSAEQRNYLSLAGHKIDKHLYGEWE